VVTERRLGALAAAIGLHLREQGFAVITYVAFDGDNDCGLPVYARLE
jgi:hypothetical protein